MVYSSVLAMRKRVTDAPSPPPPFQLYVVYNGFRECELQQVTVVRITPTKWWFDSLATQVPVGVSTLAVTQSGAFFDDATNGIHALLSTAGGSAVSRNLCAAFATRNMWLATLAQRYMESRIPVVVHSSSGWFYRDLQDIHPDLHAEVTA
jgi:hypothetical protein